MYRHFRRDKFSAGQSFGENARRNLIHRNLKPRRALFLPIFCPGEILFTEIRKYFPRRFSTTEIFPLKILVLNYICFNKEGNLGMSCGSSLGRQLKRRIANGKNDRNGIIARNICEYTKQPKSNHKQKKWNHLNRSVIPRGHPTEEYMERVYLPINSYHRMHVMTRYMIGIRMTRYMIGIRTIQ